MEAIGPILIVVAIPLMLRLIPPNRHFGLAILATLGDRSIWYDVNARWGRHLFALGGLLVLLEFVLPRDMRVWTLRAIASIGFVSVLIDSWRTANRWERERRSAASALPK
jgi:hypothetical protein